MTELGFTYNNVIRIYVPKRILSTWKYPVEKVTYRKNRNTGKMIKVKKKPVRDITIERVTLRGTDKEYCSKCKCYYQHRIRSQHYRTMKHIKNITLSYKDEYS